MNSTQQKLFNRLRKALDNISESPETAAVVESMLLEDFVVSIEVIVDDLKTRPDKEVAATLRAMANAANSGLWTSDY